MTEGMKVNEGRYGYYSLSLYNYIYILYLYKHGVPIPPKRHEGQDVYFRLKTSYTSKTS
jgi:hypothetical protein